MKPYTFELRDGQYSIVDAAGHVVATLADKDRLTAERFTAALNDYQFHKTVKSREGFTRKSTLVQAIESALRDRRATYKDEVLDGSAIMGEYGRCNSHNIVDGVSQCPPYNHSINVGNGRRKCNYDLNSVLVIHQNGQKHRVRVDLVLNDKNSGETENVN